MAKILTILLLAAVLARAEFAVKSYHELRNQNVTRQHYEESCGAASIATLLNLTSIKKLSEKEVLEHFKKDEKGVNTDMASFLELQDAFSSLGYESAGYQVSRSVFESLKVPVIVKIENDPRYPHFVVAINRNGDFVSVLDPSFGEYTASKRQFYSVWDKNEAGGYVLIVGADNFKDLGLNLPLKSQVK